MSRPVSRPIDLGKDVLLGEAGDGEVRLLAELALHRPQLQETVLVTPGRQAGHLQGRSI